MAKSRSQKETMSQKELETMAFQRSANATHAEAVYERRDREIGINAPAGRMVVQPMGEDTIEFPQPGDKGSAGIERSMAIGNEVRKIYLHNKAVEERQEYQWKRAAKAAQKKKPEKSK